MRRRQKYAADSQEKEKEVVAEYYDRCPGCNRRFKQDTLEKHIKKCTLLASKREYSSCGI